MIAAAIWLFVRGANLGRVKMLRTCPNIVFGKAALQFRELTLKAALDQNFRKLFSVFPDRSFIHNAALVSLGSSRPFTA